MSSPIRSPKPLHGMFSAVPPRYDLINHIITIGMDTGWRRKAVKRCLEERITRFLDVGCGTGDLALTVARSTGENTEIIGLDYSDTMLEKAREKAWHMGLNNRVSFVSGDASELPFEDNYFDCVGISFAFRNLTFQNTLGKPHLKEVARVVKPGGRYVIVESSQPENRIIRWLDHLYIKAFVGPVGKLLSGNRGAYGYLESSMTQYFMPSEIKYLLLQAGFTGVTYRPLFFGAAGIHVARK